MNQMNRYALAMTALDEIKRLAAETRAKHPEITDDLLEQNGAIYYMNGMNGTENTWINDGMTCDFMICYASWPQFGFIRIFGKKAGAIRVCVFEDNFMEPIEKHEVPFSAAAMPYFASRQQWTRVSAPGLPASTSSQPIARRPFFAR